MVQNIFKKVTVSLLTEEFISAFQPATDKKQYSALRYSSLRDGFFLREFFLCSLLLNGVV